MPNVVQIPRGGANEVCLGNEWQMGRNKEHMTTLASGNAGAHTMVMKATFQLEVVWNSIAFFVKSRLPHHFKGCPSGL